MKRFLIKELKDIRDDEIRILGSDGKDNKRRKLWYFVIAFATLAVAGLVWFVVNCYSGQAKSEKIPAYFEPVAEPQHGVVTVGVSDNSPLFEEATERGGYFFFDSIHW